MDILLCLKFAKLFSVLCWGSHMELCQHLACAPHQEVRVNAKMKFSYSSVRGLSPDAPTTSTESNQTVLASWEHQISDKNLSLGSGTTKTTSGGHPTQPGPGSTTAPPGRNPTLPNTFLYQLFGSRAILLPRGLFWVKWSHWTGWTSSNSCHIHFLGKAKPELVGKYSRVGSDSMGRIVYKKDSTFLHYAVDVAYKFEAWIFSSSADDLMGEVRHVFMFTIRVKKELEKRWWTKTKILVLTRQLLPGRCLSTPTGSKTRRPQSLVPG